MSEISTQLLGAPRGADKSILKRLRLPWAAKGTYWKLRHKGSCQDIFFYTTLNKVPDLTQSLYHLADTLEYSRRDIGFYLQPLERGRIAHCEYNFYYNPDDAREVGKIKTLYSQAIDLLVNGGAFFIRPYGLAADIVYDRSAGYAMALKKVKKIFDPVNIMNPGKLCF